jgi:hypothetical protein
MAVFFHTSLFMATFNYSITVKPLSNGFFKREKVLDKKYMRCLRVDVFENIISNPCECEFSENHNRIVTNFSFNCFYFFIVFNYGRSIYRQYTTLA